MRWLTLAGLVAERATRAFWPLSTIVLASLAALMLGLHETLPLEGVWTLVVAALAGLVWALVRGVRRFRLPHEAEAMARLDATMPGRPISAITDTQAIGSGDTASEAVWQAHVRRMAERTKAARPVHPDLRLAERDPFALRYVALSAFVIAAIFGSFLRVAGVTDLGSGANGQALAAGPAWEGWVEPPAYTGRPSLYLNDITRSTLVVPEGSEITLRLYGELGALTVDETVSGRIGEIPPATDPAQGFAVARSGRLAIDGEGGRSWDIRVIGDQTPEIEIAGPLERSAGGEFRQPFVARDDYGVVAGRAEISLDLSRIDRRYGLSADPEPRDPVVLDLPLTITGDRRDFEEHSRGFLAGR